MQVRQGARALGPGTDWGASPALGLLRKGVSTGLCLEHDREGRNGMEGGEGVEDGRREQDVRMLVGGEKPAQKPPSS